MAEEKKLKKCRSCGQVGGPYPNGDRPKSNSPLISGCPRCGWCW
jgi:predicted  nucleic acid-binding Zn-ribbon protein